MKQLDVISHTSNHLPFYRVVMNSWLGKIELKNSELNFELILEEHQITELNTPNIECPNIDISRHHTLAQNRTSNM